MFGLQWSARPGAKSSDHPMADLVAAAKLLKELPLGNPGRLVAEASAWLESVQSETTFTPAHRIKVVSMIDEAAHSGVEELTLAFAGVGRGAAGLSTDWRALMTYLDALGGAYRTVIDACAGERSQDLGANMPRIICRMTRAIARGMKVGWMRYLPPDRASWEALVHAYRTARGLGCAETLLTAYASDRQMTCPLFEFNVAVMLTAAAPQSVTPRRVELIHRITSRYRAAFTVDSGRKDRWRHYLVDLDHPGPPARIPDQVGAGGGVLYFRAEKIVAELKAMLDGGAAIEDRRFGPEFTDAEKRAAIEHVVRFWDDTPPARRDERTRINTRIQLALGVRSIQHAIEDAEGSLPAAREPLMVIDSPAAPGVRAEATDGAGVPGMWTLTDYSTRGIGARCARRVDGRLTVGTLIGFRLENSAKWCVAIVRRLRTDARSQTDIGAEILAKSASLATIQGHSAGGTASEGPGGGAMVHSRVLLLPEDPREDTRASLFFEAGTNAPEQTFVLHAGSSARRIKLHEATESLDGWDRVEFDWLD